LGGGEKGNVGDRRKVGDQLAFSGNAVQEEDEHQEKKEKTQRGISSKGHTH